MLDQQIAELMADEGLRLFVYDDATGQPIKPGTVVKGHPSIGVGRALDVHGISKPEAAQLLAADIFAVEQALMGFGWFNGLDPVRRGVLTNLGFNLGVHGLLNFQRMIVALQKLDFEAATIELLQSRWAHQVQQSRRDRLVQQLRHGVLAAATVAPSAVGVPVIPPAVPPKEIAANSGKTPANSGKPADTVDEDNIADALNQAELDRIRGTGQ
jgi:lysozyme